MEVLLQEARDNAPRQADKRLRPMTTAVNLNATLHRLFELQSLVEIQALNFLEEVALKAALPENSRLYLHLPLLCLRLRFDALAIDDVNL